MIFNIHSVPRYTRYLYKSIQNDVCRRWKKREDKEKKGVKSGIIYYLVKVHIFWDGHRIWKNLSLSFDVIK